MQSLKRLFSWLRRRGPRMTMPNLLANALILVVASTAPHQAPVLMYKLAAVLAGGCCGYMLDVSLFPYARPHGYLAKPWRDDQAFKEAAPDHSLAYGCQALFIAACARRAAIVGTAMLAVALAL
jgi:hypothetical protein